MSRFLALFAALSVVAVPESSSAACYTIIKDELTIYQASIAPVDMALPFSQTVPAKFGTGAMMVVSDSSRSCSQIDSKPESSSANRNEKRATSRPSGRSSLRTSSGSAHVVSPLANSVFATVEDYQGGVESAGTESAYPGVIYVGPRGGRYYFNSNGNKTYLSSRSSGRGGRR